MIQSVPDHKVAERAEIADAVSAFLRTGGQISRYGIQVRRGITTDYNGRKAERRTPPAKPVRPAKVPSTEHRNPARAIKAKSRKCAEDRAALAPSVRRLAGTGSLRTISGQLGITRTTLLRIAAEHGIDLGIRPAGPSAEQIQILADYAQAGATLRDAARWMGVPYESARYWAKTREVRFGSRRTNVAP